MRSDALPATCIVMFRETHVLYADGNAQALGGLIDCAGRSFVVLDTVGDCSAFGSAMLWAMRRMIRRQSGSLYAQCQVAKFPQAPRLLTWLGFSPTDELLNGARVWARHCS